MKGKFLRLYVSTIISTRYFLLFACSYFIGTHVTAQSDAQIQISTTWDSAEIMQQIKDARQLLNQRPDSAITLLEVAIYHSRNLKFGKGERNALL